MLRLPFLPSLAVILFLNSDPNATGTLAQEKEKAAPAQSQPPFPVPILRQSVLSNNYLKPLLELQSHEQEYLGSRFAEPYMESVVLANAYLGEYPAAYEYEEKWYARFMGSPRKRNAEDLKSSPVDGYSARDALSAIASVASARQIVVINEEHRTPVHRAFSLQLLSRLYAEGFRYFAAETLFEADADLNTRKYPLQASGFYISDPVYGDLVRTALRLGYKVVPYESAGPCSKSGDECQDERERGQAQNLVDRILRADPTAKVLVHVGRTHAAKLKLEGHYSFMAWHLKQISGIEPFTIDQTALSERKNPLDETSHYRFISSQIKPGKPTVFQDAKGSWFSPRDGYDMAVYHPRAEYQHGRPTWLKMGGARHAIEIPWKRLHLDPAKLNQEIAVQAFIAAEANDAVPIDQVLVKPGRSPFVLMLPNFAVRIRAVTASGEVLGSLLVRVSRD